MIFLLSPEMCCNTNITHMYRTALVAQTVKNLQCGRPKIELWDGKIPCRREWLPTSVVLPGQRSLVGYSPWGHNELDMTD